MFLYELNHYYILQISLHYVLDFYKNYLLTLLLNLPKFLNLSNHNLYHILLCLMLLMLEYHIVLKISFLLPIIFVTLLSFHTFLKGMILNIFRALIVSL